MSKYTVMNKKALIIIVGLTLILLIQNLVFLYNNIQNKTPIFGLKLAGISVTGLNAKQIQTLIKNTEKNRNPLQLYYNDKVIEVKRDDLGYKIDEQLATNQLMQVGRKGNILQKFLTQEKAFFGLENRNLNASLSQALLAVKLLDVQDRINQNSEILRPDFENNINNLLPPKNGIKVQRDKLTLLILNNMANPPKKPLPVPVYTDFPNQHSPEELKDIQSLAPKLLTSPVSIISGGQIFSLSPDQLKQMMVVVERPNPKNPKKTVLSLRLDDRKLNQALGDFAQKVESITNSEFDYHQARVAIYSQVYSPKNRKTTTIDTGIKLPVKVLAAQDKPGPKVAYLTFDDGPNSIYHPLILDILKTYNVQATFFLVGQNIPVAHPAAVRTFTDGHLLGNHSYTHSFLPNLSNNAIYNELDRTDNILKSIDGNQDITFFRPPYGGLNYYVRNDAHSLGLRVFLWDVDPRDWSEPSTDELVRRVVNYTRDGSDVLMHSNHLVTVKALPQIIQQLQTEGYIFKTLDKYPHPEQD